MKKARMVLAAGLTLVLVGISMVSAQEPRGAAKGKLPQFWSKLGLTEEQKTSAFKITGDYRAKIDALKQQIKDLEKQERAELDKVLTDDQKKRLRDFIAAKAGVEIPKEEKKEGGKDDKK